VSGWRAVLAWIAARRPVKEVWAELDPSRIDRAPLFRRYFLMHVCLGRLELYLYLHHYLRSDPDRGPHDHPWGWAVAVPLAGGYLEERLAGFNRLGPRFRHPRRRPFLPYRLTGADFHRVLLDRGATSWSLFAHGRYVKGWGFLRDFAPVNDIPLVGFFAADEAGDGLAWWREAPRGADLAAIIHQR
jgi:hypothetical protein